MCAISVTRAHLQLLSLVPSGRLCRAVRVPPVGDHPQNWRAPTQKLDKCSIFLTGVCVFGASIVYLFITACPFFLTWFYLAVSFKGSSSHFPWCVVLRRSSAAPSGYMLSSCALSLCLGISQLTSVLELGCPVEALQLVEFPSGCFSLWNPRSTKDRDRHCGAVTWQRLRAGAQFPWSTSSTWAATLRKVTFDCITCLLSGVCFPSSFYFPSSSSSLSLSASCTWRVTGSTVLSQQGWLWVSVSQVGACV